MLSNCLPLARRGLTRCLSTNAPTKMIKPKARRPIIADQRARNTALDAKAEASKMPWRLVGATILHRYPTITRDEQPWETAMYEIQEEDVTRRQEFLMEQIAGTKAQLIPDNEPTYEEILESMPFTPAPRVSEADKTNDRRSVERRQADSLFLIVKRNRANNAWQFPQGKLQTDENFRAAGERVIDRAVGNTNRYFISNAPVGHFQYAYTDAMQAQRKNFGAKVFFYRAQLLAGSVKLETKLYTDYAWIARDEVKEYFDAETAEFLSHLLPH